MSRAEWYLPPSVAFDAKRIDTPKSEYGDKTMLRT